MMWRTMPIQISLLVWRRWERKPAAPPAVRTAVRFLRAQMRARNSARTLKYGLGSG
jgi:hypothetical protein